MIKTFTKDDLLLYAYGETTKTERLNIENALLCDESLQEEYREIEDVRNSLDGAFLEPSENAVQSILNYSKSYNLPSVMK